MNSIHDPQFDRDENLSIPPSDAESIRLQQLCSAEIDGELTPDESAELRVLADSAAQSIETYRTLFRKTGDLLRALPIHDPGDTIVVALRKHRQSVSRPAKSEVTLQVCSPVPNSRFRGSSNKPRFAAMVSFCVLSLVVLAVSLPKADRSASGPLSPAHASVSVHAEGDDWQILVLQVASSNREALRSQILEVAQQSGFPIQHYESPQHSSSTPLGIVLTSAGAQSDQFVSSFKQSGMVTSEVWNPLEIGSLNRDALIAAVRESMLHPSQSELYFGEIFFAVATPPTSQLLADSDVAARRVVTKDSAPTESLKSPAAGFVQKADSAVDLPAAAALRSDASALAPEEVVAASAESSPSTRHLLVVFEFHDTPAAGY
jgi:hypothetical protein